jgi:hypothetical protein
VYLEPAHDIPVRAQKQGGYALVGDENGFCLPAAITVADNRGMRADRVGVSCNGEKIDATT